VEIVRDNPGEPVPEEEHGKVTAVMKEMRHVNHIPCTHQQTCCDKVDMRSVNDDYHVDPLCDLQHDKVPCITDLHCSTPSDVYRSQTTKDAFHRTIYKQALGKKFIKKILLK